MNIKKFVCLLAFSITITYINPVFSQENLNSQDYLQYMYDSQKTFDEIVEIAEEYFEVVGTDRGLGYKQFKRWEYWASRSLDENGRVITNARILKELEKFKEENPADRAITSVFTEMGPQSAVNTDTWSSHIGRITSIGLDPNDDDHIIAGSSSGGVWRTDDFGANWTPMSDEETYLNIGALEISHGDSDTYFAGTDGGGVLKSTDAGQTWVQTTGITTNDIINTVTMHPTDPNIVFAVGRWQGRIYKSTDAGDTWTSVHNDSEPMYDLEFKPGDPTVVYASGDGVVLKSTDSGDSFSSLSGPWTTGGVMMMAVTADDEDYLYILQESSGGFGSLMLSEDEGNTFTTQSDDSCNCNNIMGYNQDQTGGQAPRDMDVIVSPNDKTEVHVAGTETWKSTDSGTTWSKSTSWLVNNALPFIHADCDILIYHGSRIYAGTDGGLFYSDDEANDFTDLTTGLGVREFYRIGASETELDRVSGGSQDNGTGVVVNGTWFDFVGADGMETFIDHSDADIIYATIQFGGLYKSVNGGQTLTSISNTPGSGAWVTPLEQDPVDSNTLYQGKEQLWKSTDGGGSWDQISDVSNANGTTMKELKIAPSNNQVIYFAYNNDLWKTDDGGTSWTDITPSQSFNSVNYISIHPDDADRASITISGSAIKILETTDGGNSWIDISANLPGITAQCVQYEGDADDGMYVGMSPGIYYKDNFTAGTWSVVSGNIPNVSVTEIEIRNDMLYAATYGRGLWKSPLTTAVGNFTCENAINVSSCGNFTTVPIDQGNGASQSDATNSVWYKFTPNSTGTINISSCNAGVNTRVHIHEGSCGSLTLVDSSDDDCAIGPGQANTASELIGIPVIQDTPLYIEWDDVGSSDAFSFEIELELNYTCDSALNITAGTHTSPDMLICGGGQGATESNATHATWYKFVAPGQGLIDINSCNQGVDTRLWIYDGSCGNLNLLNNSDDSCPHNASNNYASEIVGQVVTPGQEIYIQWDDRWSTDGFDFILTFESSCDPEFILTGGQTVDADYETDGIIESTQIIGNFINLDYDSGTSIDLLNGFEVRIGTDFDAFIDGCGNLLQNAEDEENK